MTEEAAKYLTERTTVEPQASPPAFKFGMRQVVRHPSASLPGTVVGRVEMLDAQPRYFVRPCNSESNDDARPFLESDLTAF